MNVFQSSLVMLVTFFPATIQTSEIHVRHNLHQALREKRADDANLAELRAIVEQQRATIQSQGASIQQLQNQLAALTAAQPASFSTG